MYNVSANFHTLSIQDAPTTRIRIYSFNPAVVDCTDDNDVTTNGRLIRLKLTDTDSNSRIADSGVTFNYFFNKDENISIGECVSSQIEFTLLNFDGALNGIRFKQAKAYLDVWDSVNSAWVTCPMGVYILEQPTRTRQKLVGVTGFDQMQLLDAVADSWWNSIDWTGSKTLEDIINLMATQLGLHVSASLSSHLVNGNVYFTSAPFTAVQTTYKDIVHYIAEMTGTVAFFDRNGAFDMKWFSEAQISGSTVTIDTDPTGNGCFGIDISEISVAQIDGLSIFNDNPNKNVTVGTGTNPYSVYSNPLYNRLASVAIIQTVAGRVKDRIITFPSYSPITLRCIYDWSLDAGDIINVVSNTDTYVLPIMQQTLTWRGGYVVAEVMSCGKAARPSASETQRNDYQTGVNFNSRVTFTDLSTAGNTTIDGGNITTGTIDASAVNVTNLDASNITAGTMSANKISGGTLTLGGLNNTNGTLVIKDASNNITGTIDNTGANIYGSLSSSATVNGVDFTTEINGADITVLNGAHHMFSVEPKADGTYAGRMTMADSDGTLTVTGSNIYFTEQVNGGLYAGAASLRIEGTDPDNRGVMSLGGFINGGTSVGIRLDPTGGSQFDGDITVNDNLTVNGAIIPAKNMSRRALSSAGWYRILKFNAAALVAAKGSSGNQINIYIGRNNLSGGNETHFIRCSMCYNNIVFCDEQSVSTEFGIDEILYGYNQNTNQAYVDIHYNLSTENTVWAYFDVYDGLGNTLTRFKAGGLVAVAYGIGIDTIMTTYTFSANGAGQGLYDLIFGVGTEIAANSSCDSLKSPGKYTCASYAISQTVTNTPFPSYAYALFVIKVAVVERLVQVAIANSSSCTIKLRQYDGTNWNAWKTINPA